MPDAALDSKLKSPRYRTYVLAMLVVVYVFNFLDRADGRTAIFLAYQRHNARIWKKCLLNTTLGVMERKSVDMKQLQLDSSGLKLVAYPIGHTGKCSRKRLWLITTGLSHIGAATPFTTNLLSYLVNQVTSLDVFGHVFGDTSYQAPLITFHCCQHYGS